MAFRVIARDMAIRVTLGGPQDGVPTYGTATSILCITKSIKIDESATVIDVSGLCDEWERPRVVKKSAKIMLEGVVLSSGCKFIDTMGQYILVETKEHSSLSAYRSWEGVITDWSWSASGNENQVESITIALNPEKDDLAP